MSDHHLHDLGVNCVHFIKTLFAHAVHRQGGHGNAQAPHEIYQTSLMSALLEGVYEGAVTYGDLAKHGDFGLGTFNDLDGEMVALDGQFFQLQADGSAHPVDPAQKTPFAALIFFKAEITQSLSGMAEKAFFRLLETVAPSHNLFYAIRVDGRFKSVTTRTVPRQTKPYKPFTEIAKTQPTFQFTDCAGSLIGFRSPDYTQGISVAGYHLHFITADRTGGGHVLDFELIDGTLKLDHSSNLHVELPETADFLNADLNKSDMDAAIKAVEGRPSQ